MAVNILVADDSVTMRRILELTFQGEDARVTAVENGEAAVRKAAELNPDVVFADLSLSGMDGYAITSAIKAQPGGDKTAVVLMASQKHPYDDEKGRAAGVDDHILKPFDTQHVIDRVKQVLAKPRTAPARAAAAGAAAPAPAIAASAGGAAANRIGTKTIAFGKPPVAANAAQTAAPAPPQPRPQVAASAAGGASYATASAAAAPAAKPVVAPPVTTAVSVANLDLEHKLNGLGLTAEQLEAVLRLSREVIERVVWEVVPDLAETLIKEEIRRLTAS